MISNFSPKPPSSPVALRAGARSAAASPAANSSSLRLSIVIPVYNSESIIAPLVEEIVCNLHRTCQLQLILVNDGSTDGSRSECHRLHQTYPSIVEYLELSGNFGEQNAVMAGLHHADGDYCVIMDDDFQNPPSEIHKLLRAIQQGYDVVYARYPKKHHSPIRNLASLVHNWTAILTLGKPPGLYLSSFKLLSRSLVLRAIQYPVKNPHLDAIILKTTRNIATAQVHHAPRATGSSGYTYRKLLALWLNVALTYSPLPIYAAILFLILACAYAPQTLSSAGVTILLLGACGEHLRRLHITGSPECQFTVKDHLARKHLPS